MQNFHTNITKGKATARHRDGRRTTHDRYFLHYNDPATGNRRVKRFRTRKEAEAAQNNLIKSADSMARRKAEPPTLQDAVDYWLKSREGSVTDHTFKSYTQLSRDWIIGPASEGTSRQRRQYGITGKSPIDCGLIPMLGAKTKIDAIKTGQIRMWYLEVMRLATPYVARCARKTLSSIFRLIEEDFDVRLARMPSRAGPVYRRKPRKLLNEEQVKLVLEEAQRDRRWGVYYAFGFLTGTRPNEQLGLLWEDVDLAKGKVYIRRSQQPDGTLKPFTKTEAGMREIPLNAFLLEMMIEWKERCPLLNGRLHRVFPGQVDEFGRGIKIREGSDGGLLLANYRWRVWYPMLERLGLPSIPPYAARHMMISFLQAQGIEVGLVAKIAGHANPQITLQYYTHAVRDDDSMMDQLTVAYGIKNTHADKGTGVQI